jgi:hypothetical protein
VDDILIAYDLHDRATVFADLEKLNKKFKLKVLGQAKHILGVELSYLADGSIKMSQASYLRSTLKARGFDSCRSEPTPASTGKLSSVKDERLLAQEETAVATGEEDDDADAERINARTFTSVLGSFSYAANFTRPDIAQAVNFLARESSAPSMEAVLGLRRVARYLRHSLELGLVFSSAGSSVMTAYCDADWAGCDKTRRSTTGIALMLAGAAISWSSKRQTTVTLSSAEAEYTAMAECTRDVIFVRQLLAHMQQPQTGATTLYCDSQAALAIASAQTNAPRRKHIDVRHHFLREQIQAGIIAPQWISTLEQPADIFTKPLPAASFKAHRAFVMGSAMQPASLSS